MSSLTTLLRTAWRHRPILTTARRVETREGALISRSFRYGYDFRIEMEAGRRAPDRSPGRITSTGNVLAVVRP